MYTYLGEITTSTNSENEVEQKMVLNLKDNVNKSYVKKPFKLKESIQDNREEYRFTRTPIRESINSIMDVKRKEYI